jgi:hypothetical protein
MRRPLGYVLAWALATVVAVSGAWVGLQPLLAAASPDLPARLSAAQLRQAAPPPPSPTPPPPSPSPSPSPSPPPSPSPTPAAPPAPPPPQPLLPATSEWKERPGGDGYERTFIVRGGEVVFRASRADVEVVDHTANPGYEVSVNRWSSSSVILSFESAEFTSRVWVMWRDGPYAEVTESV